MKIILLISLLWSPLLLAESESMKSFQTDLCTKYPEGTDEEPMLWAHCCIKHDLAYYVAGTRKDKKAADQRLRSCVSEVAGERRGRIMYRGIRLGNWSPVKSKWRWGWAYKKKVRKRYAPVTKEQKAEAKRLLLQSDTDPKLLEEFFVDIAL